MKTTAFFRRGWLLAAALFNFLFIQAQTVLTLEKSVDIAIRNNLLLKQSANNTALAQEQLRQSRMDFYPNLNASLSLSRTQGTFQDAFSFTQAQNPIQSNVGVFSSFTLFNAFARWHNLRNSQYSLQATEQAQLALQNDICTQVTLAFFQVVYDRENVRISEQKLKTLEIQVERTQNLLKAGTRTQGDLYNVQAQVAAEKLNLVNRQNQFNKDKLTLLQLLNLDTEKEYDIQAPDPEMFSVNEILPDLDSIYDYALVNMPDIREKQLRIQAGTEQVKSAKAGLMPTLTLNLSGSSNFTSSRKEFLGNDTIGGFVIPRYGDNTVPYFTQLSDFFYVNTGFSLNIPIFNNYRNRLSYQRTSYNLENAKLDYQITRNNLVKEIQQAWLDANAARARFDAAAEQLIFLEESLRYSESKYQAGLIDFFSYSEILNNRTQAEVEKLTARYDYLLKIKILDLYQGKPLKF